MQTRYAEWTTRLNAFVAHCSAKGAAWDYKAGPPRCLVSPPATEPEVKGVEARIGKSLPASLRRVLLEYSRSVDMAWQFADQVESPGPSCGMCQWSLDTLPTLVDLYVAICHDTFPDPRDPYDRVWHERFPVIQVDNGDMLAIATHGSGEVIYLSHDDGEGHGYALGADFADFMDRWTALGCPGPEDWEWLPFAKRPKGFLNPASENAVAWLRWMAA